MAADIPQMRRAAGKLSPVVVALGLVSLLMGMSSAMVYGLLPVFLVTALGATTMTVGLIEGIAEATTSFAKIFSGAASDRIGRRKPLVVLGYGLSAVTKLLFPLAGAASTVLIARFVDRVGKGIRDAPRDALMTDVMPSGIRGSGFGLRQTLYTIGAITGLLAAILLMRASGDDFRLVFWCAAVPALLSVPVLLVGVRERSDLATDKSRIAIRLSDVAGLPAAFWLTASIAAALALARFSPAFLVLEARHVGVDAAFVPAMLVLMNVAYALAAYPFGVLADRIDRRLQLGIGTTVIIAADLVLASADNPWTAAVGAALWGLQMGVLQGLLSAMIADAAPDRLRGTAFGTYEVAVGVATFLASAAAGVLWMLGGPALTFLAGAALAGAALVLQLARPVPRGAGVSP